METVSKDIFLAEAESIAAKICRDALWSGKRCNWLGDTREYVSFQLTSVHATLGPDVYGGTAGIALFLAHIFKQTNQPIFRMTAEGAMTHALSRIVDIRPEVSSSYYVGQLGIAHTLVQVGTLLDEATLLEQGLSQAINITKQPLENQMLDVISGSGSAIPTFLFFFNRFGNEAFLQAAIQHGERLLDNVVKDSFGYSWKTVPTGEASRNLCGMAHGAGGIGLSLIELYSICQDERYLVAGEEALRYEAHWYNAEEHNYPDFRMSGNEDSRQRGPSYMMAWCHGAPGIGITRVRAYELLHKEKYKQEAERSAETTGQHLKMMSDTRRDNFSLCHGMSGNATFLLYLSGSFQNESYWQLAQEIGIAGIAEYPKNRLPWSCGILGGGETPNLMLGTAGIGYFYLSLYERHQLPPLVVPLA